MIKGNLADRPAFQLWVTRIFESLQLSSPIDHINMIDLSPVVVVTGVPEQGHELIRVLVAQGLRQLDDADGFIYSIQWAGEQTGLLAADDHEGGGLCQAVKILDGHS